MYILLYIFYIYNIKGGAFGGVAHIAVKQLMHEESIENILPLSVSLQTYSLYIAINFYLQLYFIHFFLFFFSFILFIPTYYNNKIIQPLLSYTTSRIISLKQYLYYNYHELHNIHERIFMSKQ